MIVLLACASEPPDTSKDSGYLSTSTVIDDGCNPGVVGTYPRYVDDDDDGYGDSDLPFEACVPTLGAALSGDCDDHDPAVHPGAAEPCAGPDLDCDGMIGTSAASDAVPWYDDEDGDGWGGAAHEASCEVPEGVALVPGDCDDADPGAHPEADELCDGVDQDCDGFVDEEIDGPRDWFRDDDRDGWGVDSWASHACKPPGGYVALAGDCDDGNPAVHPEATEPDCINGDGNCDGIPDDLTVDADHDGTPVCQDCDDGDPAIHPGVEDACLDGVDQDCDLVDGSCFPDGAALSSDESLEIQSGVAIGDVDGDGQDDLVLVLSTGADLEVATWRGPLLGDLDLHAPDLVHPTGSLTISRALAAASGALFVADPSSDLGVDSTGAVFLLADPEHDTIDAPAAIVTGEVTFRGVGDDLSLGDVDGDGTEDALLADLESARIALLPGDLHGLWSAGALDTIVVGEAADGFGSATTALDWDGDGVDDLVAESGYSGALSLYAGPLDGVIDAADAMLSVAATDEVLLRARMSGGPDLDGDGREDLVVAELDAVGSRIVRLYPGGSAPVTVDDATWELADPLLTETPDTLLATRDAQLVVGVDTAQDGRGASWVFAGPLVGSATTADAVAAWIGTTDDGGLGGSGAVGDLDGDGVDDAAIGERDTVWLWPAATW